MFDGKHRVEYCVDRFSGIHGDDHHGRVLRQRQRLIGSEVAPRAEAADAAQHDAAGNAVLFIQAKQHFGDKTLASPSTLGQIDAELQAIFIHGRSSVPDCNPRRIARDRIRPVTASFREICSNTAPHMTTSYPLDGGRVCRRRRG